MCSCSLFWSQLDYFCRQSTSHSSPLPQKKPKHVQVVMLDVRILPWDIALIFYVGGLGLMSTAHYFSCCSSLQMQKCIAFVVYFLPLPTRLQCNLVQYQSNMQRATKSMHMHFLLWSCDTCWCCHLVLVHAYMLDMSIYKAKSMCWLCMKPCCRYCEQRQQSTAKSKIEQGYDARVRAVSIRALVISDAGNRWYIGCHKTYGPW